MSLPLILTLARIVLAPIFLIFYLYHDAIGIRITALPYLLIVLLGLSELSDVLDGILARKKNQVTDLGKLLDPMADSIFRLSVFLTFTQGIIRLPLLLVLFFFYRDTIIGTLRALCALRGVALAARKSGKIKAVLQAMAAFFILILMIPYSMDCLSLSSLRQMSLYVTSVVLAYTLYSGIEYILANRGYIKKALLKLDR